jgi:hypothetical protein
MILKTEVLGKKTSIDGTTWFLYLKPKSKAIHHLTMNEIFRYLSRILDKWFSEVIHLIYGTVGTDL